jgi:ribosomal protein S18 acetylase RimI-like enzyme
VTRPGGAGGRKRAGAPLEGSADRDVFAAPRAGAPLVRAADSDAFGAPRVRPAEPRDRAAFVALARSVGVARASAERHFDEDVASGDRLLLVAEVDGTVAGYGRTLPFGPGRNAPAGLYLLGMAVDERRRRRGLGTALTRARMAWAIERAGSAWYFTNARNAASLAVHTRLGFREVTRDFDVPGVTFAGGVGVLCRAP